MRNLVIILGDQLSEQLPAFDGFDRNKDMIWMAEVSEESEKVWCSKQRIALFLSAMRHFAEQLKSNSYPIHYRKLDDEHECKSLGTGLSRYLENNNPEKVILTQPGEYWVLEEIKQVCAKHSLK